MKKYYRVLQDNFLWKAGAIIEKGDEDDGYKPITDLWDTTEFNNTEYISTKIIEAPENAQYFERVYAVNKIKKTVYLVKEKAQEEAAKFFNEA